MPEGIKQLSVLERATSITPEALIYSEVEDISSESGFSTRALPLGLLAEGVANEVEFASALDTDSKTLIGAINELKVALDQIISGGIGGTVKSVNGIQPNDEGNVVVKVADMSDKGTYATKSDLNQLNQAVTTQLNRKQATLVSGSNIKTINGESILGSGNIET